MGKGEIARYEQFLFFPQCFQKACFPGASKGVIVWEWVKQFRKGENAGLIYLQMLSKSVFTLSQTSPWFLRVCRTSLKKKKTLWEKEKLLVSSNFSFSHIVFYPFGKLSAIFIEFKIVVCRLFEF